MQQILNETSAGGVSVNDTIFQIACPDMAFGGVGASGEKISLHASPFPLMLAPLICCSPGTGAYNGKHTFETFSHRKAGVLALAC